MPHDKLKHYKYNYLFLVLEGSFFMGGCGFFNNTTVIPVFINNVTHNKLFVGLTVTIASFFPYFGRLLIGPFVPYIKNHVRFASVVMLICRPAVLFAAFFIFAGKNVAAVYVLMITYAVVWLADGLIVSSWSEILANTVEKERHARLLGAHMLFGGMASIMAGIMINFFLANPHFDINMAFGWVFLFGGILFAASSIVMFFTHYESKPYQSGKVKVLGYYKNLPKYLKTEKDFTRMQAVNFLVIVAAMGIPFVILFGSDRLGMTKSSTALLIFIQSVAIPIGGWLCGQICDRLGLEKGIKFAGLNTMAAAALPLIALLVFQSGGNPLFLMGVAMFLAGMYGGWACCFLYTVQVVRPESRSACLVLSSFLTMPATFSGYLAGVISNQFGYIILFVTCIVLSAAAIALSFRLRPVDTVLKERQADDKGKQHNEMEQLCG